VIYEETITKDMKDMAKVIFESLDGEYYLAGGTALALQIGHRKSIDLDYFINSDINIPSLKADLIKIFPNRQVEFVYEEKNTLWCVVDEVKISFISRFDSLVKNIITEDCFRLASLEDILSMKLSAICNREEYKDYFDLACLATLTDVRSWDSWWQKAYPNSDSISYLVALANVEAVPLISLDVMEKFKDIFPSKIIPGVVSAIKKFMLG